MNHFDISHPRADHHGPAPMVCDLLAGIFLAADPARVRQKGLRFDPAFHCHCHCHCHDTTRHDTDFSCCDCALELSVGTKPNPVTPGGWGSFEQEWLEACLRLRHKLSRSANGEET